jgi:hypothetical protein
VTGRHLRPVGDDERMPEKSGSLQVVVDDLEVAHGHVVEACAELAECPEDTTGLLVVLMGVEKDLGRCLQAARDRLGPS